MRRVFSVLVALLIVSTATFSVVGSATAQTNQYEHTYTGSPGQVVVDFGTYSGSVDIVFNAPSINQPVYATTISTNQIDSNRVRITNHGAYEDITVTITGPSTEPTYEQSDVQLFGNSHSFGSTGADTDMECGSLEQVDQANGFESVIDCTGYPGVDDINTTSTDSQQLQQDIYQDALDTQATTNNTLTITDNYLNDTETSARIQGQNAYIRALNNGSSESSARVAARSAISDYYATHQRNLIETWNLSLSNWQYVNGVANNESGISGAQVPRTIYNDTYFVDVSGADDGAAESSSYGAVAYDSNGTTSVTLVNGETATAMSYTLQGDDYYSNTGELRGSNTVHQTYSPSSAPTITVTYDHTTVYTDNGELVVRSPGNNLPQRTVHNPQEFERAWSEIESQNQRVQDDMDTIVNNTYADYQSGQINNSDLVSPHVLSQRSAGESHQSWAAAMLTSIGSNSPDTLESTGGFEVATSQGTYTGILFIEENTQIENGTTYDSSNLNGTEYLVTANDTVELTGTWTVERITTTNGTGIQNVTYEDTTYKASNASELADNYDNLLEERAEIEAREQNLENSGGGALFGTSQSSLLVMMLLGGGVVFYIMREGDEV